VWEFVGLRWIKVGILHAVLPRVINSRILETRGMRSLDRRLVPKIHVAALVNGDPQAATARNIARGHKLTTDLIIAAVLNDRIVSQLHIIETTIRILAMGRRAAILAILRCPGCSLDRIRRPLVGLKMPRVLEVLDQTVRQLELGEASAHLQGRGHESSCCQARRPPAAW
jgi:hypothetical protein